MGSTRFRLGAPAAHREWPARARCPRRRVAGFSNEEEDAVGLTGIVPFALETRLRDLGGLYESGPKWGSFAVRDGRLVTGQNPASSAAVAKLVIQAIA